MIKLFECSLGNQCSQRSQLSPFLKTLYWKCISRVISKIMVVSVVRGEIIFYVDSKISVVSVVSGVIVFYKSV